MAYSIQDYIEETRRDALEYVRDEYSQYDADDFDQLWEDLDMTVTGDEIGSYTRSASVAAENVAKIIWEAEFIEELRGFGYESVPFEKGPEAVDVIARGVYVGYAHDECEELFNELKQQQEDY